MPPATSASPWRNDRRALDQAGRRVGEELRQVGDVGRRVHPHQHQVVALGEHVVVHLRRPLGGDQQVEPELAALPGDPHGVLGRERGQRLAAGRAGRRCGPRRSRTASGGAGRAAPTARASTASATVARSASTWMLPRSTTSARQSSSPSRPAARLDGPRADQIDHSSRPRLRIRRLSAASRRATGCAGRPSSSATVARPRPRARSAVSSAAYSSRSRSGSSSATARRLRAPRSKNRSAACRRRCPPERRTSHVLRALGPAGRGRRDRRPSRSLGQAREVRVGVEHDDPQVGLQQQLLEHHAQRVRLARAGLPAEEGMAAEPARVQPRPAAPGRTSAPPIVSRAPRGAVDSRHAASWSWSASAERNVVERLGRLQRPPAAAESVVAKHRTGAPAGVIGATPPPGPRASSSEHSTT